jgi:protein-S-isoprenylcysteine O-methyltransferase Ste14
MALIEELEEQGNVLFKFRSYIPIFFLASGLGVYAYKIYDMTYPDLGFNYWLISLAVGLLGLLVRIYTVGHTPANTSGRNTTEGQVADELNQTGIYSIVRHPLYLGNFLMWMGVAMLTADLWYLVAFTFTYWVYYERIMFAEEAFLRRKFGEAYLKWASDKPAFIPKLQSPDTPKYPFSIKASIRA